jgi:ribosomal protein S18 acetylase RimI-like enzyme
MARVWLASEADAGAVAELLVAFRDWWQRDDPSDASVERSAARLLADPDTDFLLASASPEGPAAGICQLRYRHSVWTGTPDCALEDLFVREEARRAGLARALVGSALARARERGCARIELDVNEANPPALALYEAMGFSAWSDPPGGRRLLMRRAL